MRVRLQTTEWHKDFDLSDDYLTDYLNGSSQWKQRRFHEQQSHLCRQGDIYFASLCYWRVLSLLIHRGPNLGLQTWDKPTPCEWRALAEPGSHSRFLLSLFHRDTALSTWGQTHYWIWVRIPKLSNRHTVLTLKLVSRVTLSGFFSASCLWDMSTELNPKLRGTGSTQGAVFHKWSEIQHTQICCASSQWCWPSSDNARPERRTEAIWAIRTPFLCPSKCQLMLWELGTPWTHFHATAKRN